MATEFLRIFYYLKSILVIYSLLQSLKSEHIAWETIIPSTCVSHLNFTMPDQQIELNISLRVLAIYDVSEEKMEFGMQFDLLEIWRDPYMTYPEFREEGIVKSTIIPNEIVNCIWKPDTVFRNAKDITLYHDYGPNIYYKLVQPSNKIVRKSRFKVTAACPMRFEYYPMDSQKCSLEISTFYSRKNHVLMEWSKEFRSSISVQTPLNFAIKSLPKTKSEVKSSRVTSITETLHANFLFERSLSASLFNTYIPSFLVVCLSMVSFWLDVEAVPGRVTLGVTAILTLSTQIVQARSSLPPLDYMTAMDVWLLGCLIVVFLSLMEFTLANSLSRRLKKLEQNVGSRCNNFNEKSSVTWIKKFKVSIPGSIRKSKPYVFFVRPRVRSAKKRKEIFPTTSNDTILDRVSRVFFPIATLCFGVFYWVYFFKMAYN